MWANLAAVIAFALFLSTLQTDINGSEAPYATDVGNIQNALPRWGLVHRPGYPLYCLGGSLFVNGMRLLGLEPAAGASLWSAIWGAVTVALLAILTHALGSPVPAAAWGGLVAAISTSLWVDASLAEVHTLTMAFIAASLLLALRFEEKGKRADLLLLTLAFSQGVAHHRSVLLLTPAVLLLVAPRLRSLGRALLPMAGLAALAPLVYLYLPLRAWQGVKWMSSVSPGTWPGFWAMVADTKVGRVVQWPRSVLQIWMRAECTLGILADDLPLIMLALGLLGLLLPAFYERRRQALALTLAWMPYGLLCILIWEGHVSDALLAAKLPMVLLSGVGLALLAGWLARRLPGAKLPLAIMMIGLLLGLAVAHRPAVLAISRDPAAEEIISTAEQVAPPAEGRPIAFMALWGREFWALAYAQTFREQLPGLNLVPHDANFGELIARGSRLLTLSRTMYRYPISWWEEHLGRVYLSSAAPGVVELGTAPLVHASEVPVGRSFELGNSIRILSAQLVLANPKTYMLTVYWQAGDIPAFDYSVAVHLVAHDPPRGPQDILIQADRPHPVDGWYPTSRWSKGEIVRDHYRLRIPNGSQPVAVRVAMYRQAADGQFINSAWLSLPLSTSP
ncbi:MAG: DUF2723 domain-containing protein [Chloroflexota bacterium]|nr:DUF2723 domain-containing protein [Chloroflexota bacterium]